MPGGLEDISDSAPNTIERLGTGVEQLEGEGKREEELQSAVPVEQSKNLKHSPDVHAALQQADNLPNDLSEHKALTSRQRSSVKQPSGGQTESDTAAVKADNNAPAPSEQEADQTGAQTVAAATACEGTEQLHKPTAGASVSSEPSGSGTRVTEEPTEAVEAPQDEDEQQTIAKTPDSPEVTDSQAGRIDTKEQDASKLTDAPAEFALPQKIEAAIAIQQQLLAENQSLQRTVCQILAGSKTNGTRQIRKGLTLQSKILDFGGGTEVRYSACLKELAKVEESRAVLDVAFAAQVHQKKTELGQAQREAGERAEAAKRLVDNISPEIRVQALKSNPTYKRAWDRYVAKEACVEASLQSACLEHLRAQAAVHKHEAAEQAKAEKAGGASLMEYEQLWLENHRLQDRRHEASRKLQHLASEMQRAVHIVAHLREKGNSIKRDEAALKQKLSILDALCKERQDTLLACKVRYEQALLAQRQATKDMNHVTDPVLLKEYQRLVDLKARLLSSPANLQLQHKL